MRLQQTNESQETPAWPPVTHKLELNFLVVPAFPHVIIKGKHNILKEFPVGSSHTGHPKSAGECQG